MVNSMCSISRKEEKKELAMQKYGKELGISLPVS